MANSRLHVVLIDVVAEDFENAKAFWSRVLGAEPRRAEDSPYWWWEEPAPGIAFGMQRIEEGPSRVHIDVAAADVPGEADRLEALGATRGPAIDEWVQLTDPAGLVFCVVPGAETPD
jgi:predicted enzyme related to lactoylglutathione lyase